MNRLVSVFLATSLAFSVLVVGGCDRDSGSSGPAAPQVMPTVPPQPVYPNIPPQPTYPTQPTYATPPTYPSVPPVPTVPTQYPTQPTMPSSAATQCGQHALCCQALQTTPGLAHLAASCPGIATLYGRLGGESACSTALTGMRNAAAAMGNVPAQCAALPSSAMGGYPTANPYARVPPVDRTRRSDLDANCLRIGAPPVAYRAMGPSSRASAITSGCRPGLNMFGRPDPDIFCCPF